MAREPGRELSDESTTTAKSPTEEAMAVYSADGQTDDATGNDAAAEQLRDTDEHVPATNDEGMPPGPN